MMRWLVSGRYIACSVGGGGDHHRLPLDAAGALAGVLGELDVALGTPRGAPGILYEPVVLAILGTITND